MTELEKIERAKMYMDKLANGINPLDDTPIPDGDIVNHVRLSRCFFFVSDVLRRVIENKGVTPPPAKPKVPFALSPEERSRFPFSETPLPASEIARRLNALTDREDMGKISYGIIVSWLMSTGFLELLSLPSGKSVKHPTHEGVKAGITLEKRTNSQGDYQVVVYDLQAQRLVVDNLEAIMAFDRARLEMEDQPWSPEEDARLRELYQHEVPVKEIARELRRRVRAVRSRLRELGIPEK